MPKKDRKVKPKAKPKKVISRDQMRWILIAAGIISFGVMSYIILTIYWA